MVPCYRYLPGTRREPRHGMTSCDCALAGLAGADNAAWRTMPRPGQLPERTAPHCRKGPREVFVCSGVVLSVLSGTRREPRHGMTSVTVLSLGADVDLLRPNVPRVGRMTPILQQSCRGGVPMPLGGVRLRTVGPGRASLALIGCLPYGLRSMIWMPF